MKANEFIVEELQHPDAESFIANPFSQSLIQKVVYHGTGAMFEKFKREAGGIYVSQYYDYAASHYAAGDDSSVMPLYVDVRKLPPKDLHHPAVDAAFDRDYETVGKWLTKFEQEGFDAIYMGGDGSSLILNSSVPIVHAISGKEM